MNIEAQRIMNARKQQVVIKDSRLIPNEPGFWKLKRITYLKVQTLKSSWIQNPNFLNHYVINEH